MLKSSTKILSRAGIIASLYIVLSLLTFPVASGAVQFRASELLTLLPLLYLEAVPALFIGCILSNLITGCALLDVVIGSLITLIASTFTFLFGKIFKKHLTKILIGGFFHVMLNGFLLPLIWLLCYGTGDYVYLIQVALLLLGQVVTVYGLGTPTYLAVVKLKSKGVGFLE